MRDKTKKIALVAISAIMVFAGVFSYLFFASTHVSADGSSDQEIMRKTLLNALRVCYSDTYMVSEIDGTTYNYGDITSLLTKSGKDDQIIKVPSAKVGNSFNSFPKSITCEEVFIGAQQKAGIFKKEAAMTGLLDMYSLGDHPDLTMLGYHEDQSTVGEKGCLQVSAKRSINGMDTPVSSNKICFSLDSDGKIIYDNGLEEPITVDDSACPRINVNYLAGVLQIGCNAWSFGNYVDFEDAKFDTVTAELQTIADGMENWMSPGGESLGLTSGKVEGKKESGESFSNFVKSSHAVTEVLTKLTGVGPNAALFTGDDVAYLWEKYYQYLKTNNIISESNPCQVSPDIAQTETYPYVHYDSESGQYCGVRITGESLQHEFNVVASNMMELTTVSTERLLELITNDTLNHGGTMESYCEARAWERVAELTAMYDEEMAKWSEDHSYDLTYAAKISQTINKIKTMIAKGELVGDDGKTCVGLPNPDGGTDGPVSGDLDPRPSEGEGGGTGDDTPTCYEGASSLGWILCPVLEMMANVSQSAYENVKEDFLEVDASMYSSNSPAHNTWKEIRNWGNLLFVILLLIVIFSQVTGVGLDNYSIKKVLPRLIMVVVLTNLSFIICQLLIDFSNIAGDQIYKLLEGINIGNTSGTYDFGNFVQNIIGTLFTGVVGGAGVFVAAVTWDKWLIPLLLFFLVTVIGVLFFGILLAVRKAAVIILAIFSPIAIICYALPNTKRVYDRWFKLFSSMLLLYPICGALMGGGIFASKLLLSVSSATSTGFFFQLVAMLVQIVPFFFVPTLVRSSFAAMGNLGNRMMGLRDRLSRSATGAIRNAEAVKDAQQRMSGFNAQRRALRYQNNRDARGRLGDWMKRHGMNGDRLLNSNSRNRAQTRAINTAGAQMLANQIASQTAASGMSGIEDRQSAQLIKHFMDTYDNDAAFKADLDEQEKAYDQALAELDADPENQEARAKVRALQKFMGATADGQDKVKKAMYRRLYKEQQTALSEGRSAKVSKGMQFAAQTLMAENGGAFKSGDRGFSKAMKEMARGENGNVFNGQFRELEHRDDDGNLKGITYHNDAYGAESWKADASSLANANDTALDDALAAINSGTMSADRIEDIYRNATDALTNENIHVKSENEGKLNNIRRAAHNAMASSTSLYDSNGRLFNRQANGQYTYVDDSEHTHVFTRAADGSLIEQGGGMTVAADQIVKASERFSNRYGNSYSDAHTGDSMKISHDRPQARAHVSLPPGVVQRADGSFVNIATGNPLTGTELQRAQAIARANVEADIYNAQNGLNPPSP